MFSGIRFALQVYQKSLLGVQWASRWHGRGTMRCMKCKGLMVVDNLIDMRESYHPMWMRGWRCVACGNIVDPLILRHRMIQESGALDLLKVEAPPLAYFRRAKASA
jgi:hypothetical protein